VRLLDESPDQLSAAPSHPVTEATDDEFALFQALILREAGINLGLAKKPMLVGRVMRRVNALKLRSFGDYYRYAVQDRAGEMVRLLDAICTNETWFFRNPKHFSFVRDTLCPAWIAEADTGKRRRRISAWSAAASTGEEPFSLAMVLLDALPGWDLQILATDLSTRVLDRALEATWVIEKSGDIPFPYLKRYMLRGTGTQAGKMQARSNVRSLITFRRLNLNDELWRIDAEAQFDLVFCRNVLMYFDVACRERALRRIIGRLAPTGYLFLGDAEGLNGFEAMRHVAPSLYTFKANADVAEQGAGEPMAKSAR
jgi:chemotaxis protein methyltransferase CheR